MLKRSQNQWVTLFSRWRLQINFQATWQTWLNAHEWLWRRASRDSELPEHVLVEGIVGVFPHPVN